MRGESGYSLKCAKSTIIRGTMHKVILHTIPHAYGWLKSRKLTGTMYLVSDIFDENLQLSLRSSEGPQPRVTLGLQQQKIEAKS